MWLRREEHSSLSVQGMRAQIKINEVKDAATCYSKKITHADGSFYANLKVSNLVVLGGITFLGFRSGANY
jgi:hypothetical protein